jgi:NDP-sugar pyrophosphorylase family protein
MSDMSVMNDITAIVLAGGLGTRLRAVVADQPKVLAEVSGRPYLAYLLDQLSKAGIQKAILCIGYRGEQVRDAFGNRYAGMQLRYSFEKQPLGTAGAIAYARDTVTSRYVLVMNGDSYCQVDLCAYASWYQTGKFPVSLLLTEAPDIQRFGQVQMDNEGKITSFEEKGCGQGAGLINAGIYLVDRKLLDDIPAGRPVSIEQEMFPKWLSEGLLFGYAQSGKFIDIGTPESYREAALFFETIRNEEPQ